LTFTKKIIEFAIFKFSFATIGNFVLRKKVVPLLPLYLLPWGVSWGTTLQLCLMD